MRPVIAPVLGAVALTAPARPVGDEVPVDPKADDHAPAFALVGIALVALSPRGLVDQQAVDTAAQLGAARHDVDDALAVVGFPATDDRHRSRGGVGRDRESDERPEVDVQHCGLSTCLCYTPATKKPCHPLHLVA